MRKRQCKFCNGDNKGNNGEVIQRVKGIGFLPGIKDIAFPTYDYTVQCNKCGHTWTYRKKRK